MSHCDIALNIQGRIFQIFFVHILGNATTSYFHSEISWPLWNEKKIKNNDFDSVSARLGQALQKVGIAVILQRNMDQVFHIGETWNM